MKCFSTNSVAIIVGMWLSETAGNNQQENMLVYGTEVVLCSFIKIILIVVLSSLMGIFKETVTIVIASGLFRLLTGGVHASTYYRCLIISLAIFLSLGFTLNAILPQVVSYNYLYLYLLMLPGLYWTIKYAPSPPINKPLKNKKDYRNRKIFAVLIYLCVIGLLSIATEWWSVAIGLGITWQAFTLAPLGHIFIEKLNAILSIKGKEESSCETVS